MTRGVASPPAGVARTVVTIAAPVRSTTASSIAISEDGPVSVLRNGAVLGRSRD